MSKQILPMKIAYLTGEYPRATDTFIQREVAGLRALGMSVSTCSIRKTSQDHLVGTEQKREAANTFYILQAARNPLRLVNAIVKGLIRHPMRFFKTLKLAQEISPPGFSARLYHLFYFAEALILAEYLCVDKVTHLHNHIAKASCTVALLTSQLSGISYSFTLHGPDIFFEPHRWRLDVKIARASFVACISNYCRSQAMIFSAESHWPKLHIVHCGVDPDRYAPEIRTENMDRKNLLFVGRLAAVKGLPILFHALAEISERYQGICLSLIGDGPERAELEESVKQLGLSKTVKFQGYRSQSDVAAELAQTDILILPSFAEGVPVVLMEAMAAQVPVVTSQIAGIPELVERNSGILTPPGDRDALRQAIESLFENPDKRLKMGRAGRKKVIADFNIERETKWLAELLNSYANNGDRPPVRNVP